MQATCTTADAPTALLSMIGDGVIQELALLVELGKQQRLAAISFSQDSLDDESRVAAQLLLEGLTHWLEVLQRAIRTTSSLCLLEKKLAASTSSAPL